MASNPNGILGSWKEIAAYLGKGVRTVQRWERDLSLPVRRPIAHDKRIVIAVPLELDAWVRRQMPHEVMPSRGQAPTRCQEIQRQVLKVMQVTRHLQLSSEHLLEEVQRIQRRRTTERKAPAQPRRAT